MLKLSVATKVLSLGNKQRRVGSFDGDRECLVPVRREVRNGLRKTISFLDLRAQVSSPCPFLPSKELKELERYKVKLGKFYSS